MTLDETAFANMLPASSAAIESQRAAGLLVLLRWKNQAPLPASELRTSDTQRLLLLTDKAGRQDAYKTFAEALNSKLGLPPALEFTYDEIVYWMVGIRLFTPKKKVMLSLLAKKSISVDVAKAKLFPPSTAAALAALLPQESMSPEEEEAALALAGLRMSV